MYFKIYKGQNSQAEINNNLIFFLWWPENDNKNSLAEKIFKLHCLLLLY